MFSSVGQDEGCHKPTFEILLSKTSKETADMLMQINEGSSITYGQMHLINDTRQFIAPALWTII